MHSSHLLMLGLSPPAYLATPSSAAAYWAQFYTDDNCEHITGDTINMGNPGCLTGPRKSMKLHKTLAAGSGVYYSLIASPEKGCNCQSQCRDLDIFNDKDTCLKIDESTVKGASYHFRGGNCDHNKSDKPC
ncbi:hypothetical protein N7512_006480 [Penicillium capsulatum]|nr:hypothetical protein N7512_006480 [Penicillium capsulatum]